jgi:photosystem II stability/assembly factor-like uncharacterized protein
MRTGVLLLLLAGLTRAQETWPYLTYIGGRGEDNVRWMTSDGQGNTFIAGITLSIGPPFSDAAPDRTFASQMYLMKLDGAGQVVFSKILGTGFSVGAVAADQAGNVFVGGVIQAAAGFATPGAYQEQGPGFQPFVAKFSPSGEKLFATYFSAGLGTPQVNALGVDADGRPIFCGSGPENAIPLTSGSLFRPVAQRSTGYCAQLSADGSQLLFSTLLGNTNEPILPRSLAFDANGDLLVAGSTGATDFPVVNTDPFTDQRRTLFGPTERGSGAMGGAAFGSIVSIQRVGQEVFAGTRESGNWVSGDRGATWRRIPGPWSGALVAHPLDTRMLCTTTGATQLLCSSDGGANWQLRVGSGAAGVVADPRVAGGFFVMTRQWGSTPDYIALGGTAPRFNAPGPIAWMEVDRAANRVWAVVLGRPDLFVSEDGGATFRPVAENILRVAAAESRPERVYGVRAFYSPGRQSVVIRSDDGGATWNDMALEIPFSVVQQLVVDPADPDVVYVVQGNGAFVSTDGGSTWQVWMPPGLGNLAVSALHFDSENQVWIGTVATGNGFVMKLSLAAPEIKWSRLIGGTGGGGFNGIRVDGNGRSYLMGFSLGFDLPTTGDDLGPRRQHAPGFAAVLDANGDVESLRYLGVMGVGLGLAPDGSVHLAATANPSNLWEEAIPVRGAYGGGASDAIWMTLAPDLSGFLQATWLGGAGSDQAFAVDWGIDGRIRVAGSTTSRNLPVSGDAWQSQFAQGDAMSFQADGFLAISGIPF